MAKTVLITGCSSGMGKDAAIYFAQKGWNVAATMRRPARDGEELAAIERIKTYELDVLKADQIKLAITESISDFGGLDVIVNNAGFGMVGPVEGASEADIDRQIGVNLRGPISVMRAALPHFRAQKSGIFINVTSIGGRMTMPMNALYHGAKWGLEGLTEAMNYELNPFGIKARLVEPGGTKTDFATRSIHMTDASIDPLYEAITNQLIGTLQGRSDNWNPPRVVSEVIYEAATDSSERIRYLSGDDAKAMWTMRQELGDEAWVKMMKAQFGLDE